MGGGGGGKECGFTGVVWKGLSEGLTSQQRSDWRGGRWSEGASKRDIRRDSVSGRGNSVSKDLKSGVCSVCSRNSTEASTPGTEQMRGREGGRRRIGQEARSHSLRTGWPQREPQANSDSNCTRSAPCPWPALHVPAGLKGRAQSTNGCERQWHFNILLFPPKNCCTFREY